VLEFIAYWFYVEILNLDSNINNLSFINLPKYPILKLGEWYKEEMKTKWFKIILISISKGKGINHYKKWWRHTTFLFTRRTDKNATITYTDAVASGHSNIKNTVPVSDKSFQDAKPLDTNLNIHLT
jgi:hypothetical protein